MREIEATKPTPCRRAQRSGRITAGAALRASCAAFMSLALATCSTFEQPAESPRWRALIVGEGLEGWHRLGGSASFRREGDEIVGSAVPDSPNTFLATRETFGDFVLEYEAKVDQPLNSGVMVRGLSDPGYRDGVVHGYQVEFDPGPRAWSGGIYDEQRRGWINNLTRNPQARQAFRQGQWNRFRVEAVGDRIRTWINGVPAANLVDDMTARGFVALQVHSIADADPALRGAEVRFRGMRILTDAAAAHVTAQRPEPVEHSWLANRLTAHERATGWKLLWDGRSTAGWRGAKSSAFPAVGWSIHDGLLEVAASGGAESRNGGDIVTGQAFSDFELQLDFRLTPGANSGIKYFVDTGLLRGEGSAIGLEFQLLDDARHPDARLGIDGNRTLGSLYDLIPARNLSEPAGTEKRFNPSGEWNRARIVAHGGHVEHWLNDVKVVEYERGSPGFRALVARSKYKIWPDFGERASGPILLQDHGNAVAFRSIKIRDLSR
jgi:hypothetical protein